MDKISVDDIANIEELPLVSYLECPIDNMISLNPEMCKKCETCFCKDCINNWKSKSNVCPMRCNPIELINIDRTILKQQMDKIRLTCDNHKLGCGYKPLIKEKVSHEKNCEYQGVRCDKCQETVPKCNLNLHLFEACRRNMVVCLVCSENLNLANFLQHMESCNDLAPLCPTCWEPNGKDHIKSCKLKLTDCPRCNLPELLIEVASGNHHCLNELNATNLNTYLKSVHSKYEGYINDIITKQEDNFKDISKRFGDVSNEILKRENDKSKILESNLKRVTDEYSRKMYSLKKDKNDVLKKLNAEILELEGKLEFKSKEIEGLPVLFEKKKQLMIKEYELKIQAKKQNLEFLRNLVLETSKVPVSTEINIPQEESKIFLKNFNSVPVVNTKIFESEPNTDKQSVLESVNLYNSMNATLQCRYCNKEVEDTLGNRCGFCSMALCRDCTKQCSNKNFLHAVNSFCKDCFAECSLCLEHKQCKSCIKKCFYKLCNNLLCNTCYDKNRHQLRPENTACRFYKCDNCQTDSNCILTTVYCAKCDRRVCKNCYHSSHKDHLSLK